MRTTTLRLENLRRSRPMEVSKMAAPQTAIGLWPPPATCTLTSGRRINQADYNAVRDGSIASSFDPRRDDPGVVAYFKQFDAQHPPLKDPTRNADGSLIAEVGVR